MGVRRGMDPLPGIGASAVAGVEPGVDFAGETDAEYRRPSRLAAERAADAARLGPAVPG